MTDNIILHKADTRGEANNGWLHSRYTFNFANYYNPERIHFGALRVLNDDWVAPGKGFGTHPHDNMEIISIPLEGDLGHKDSMGNVAIIKHGDVKVADFALKERDGLGLRDVSGFRVTGNSNDAEVLLMEVPMTW